MKTVIEMAREAGFTQPEGETWYEAFPQCIARFAELIRADERKKWEDQTAVEINEAVLDEREACAKVCEEQEELRGHTPFDCAAAIRARGEASIRSNNDH